MSPSSADVAPLETSTGSRETADEALDCALRALERRDRTQREIEDHLRARGFSAAERTRALAALRRTGIVDDGRFARSRAASLASRGAGDALIRARLAEAGITKDDADDALETLESEAIRAGRIVVSRGVSAKTARYLYGQGFSEDVVAGIVAGSVDGELG